MTEETCYRCMLFATKGNNTTLLQGYLDTISEELWTPSELYGKRLDICRQCSDNRYGMCFHCADFVEVRCARRDVSCPSPKGKW